MKSSDDQDWWTSFERDEAVHMWERAGKRGSFENSKYFANARLAFRRRVNGSPNAETT